MFFSIMMKKWLLALITYLYQGQSTKTTPYLWPKWPKSAKIDTLFMTKTAENPYPLGPHIPIYIAHKREYPPQAWTTYLDLFLASLCWCSHCWFKRCFRYFASVNQACGKYSVFQFIILSKCTTKTNTITIPSQTSRPHIQNRECVHDTQYHSSYI